MANLGPVRLTTAGDRFVDGCRALVILWEGVTTAGDTATLTDPTTGTTIWRGRTDTTNTYLGANFGGEGIPLPNGFQLSQISAGTVYVYLREA